MPRCPTCGKPNETGEHCPAAVWGDGAWEIRFDGCEVAALQKVYNHTMDWNNITDRYWYKAAWIFDPSIPMPKGYL